VYSVGRVTQEVLDFTLSDVNYTPGLTQPQTAVASFFDSSDTSESRSVHRGYVSKAACVEKSWPQTTADPNVPPTSIDCGNIFKGPFWRDELNVSIIYYDDFASVEPEPRTSQPIRMGNSWNSWDSTRSLKVLPDTIFHAKEARVRGSDPQHSGAIFREPDLFSPTVGRERFRQWKFYETAILKALKVIVDKPPNPSSGVMTG